VGAGSNLNTFDGFYCEANASGDFEVSGSGNRFNNCTASSIAPKAPIYSIKGITFKAGATLNKWDGGYFYAGMVEPTADSNEFWNFRSAYKVFDSGKNTAKWGLELYNSGAILPATLNVGRVAGLPVYPNNAAAIAAGLTAGAFYRNGGDPDVVCVVH
jgi:hypothetical protein